MQLPKKINPTHKVIAIKDINTYPVPTLVSNFIDAFF